MKTAFIAIYRFFQHHRVAFWAFLVASFAVLIFQASRLKIDENLLSFFPKSSDEETEFVMKNMRAMDKIVVIVSNRDSLDDNNIRLIDAA